MSREPEKPQAFDAAQLRLLKSTMQDYASAADRALTYLEAKGEPALWVFKAPSLARGLGSIRSYMDALEESLHAAATGKPVTEETRKGRGN